MPTPVNAARQCLTQEAAAALDEAVAVARRRGHAQTTSMHMVSSLLSLPNSSLREACMRTRNNAYSTRVQFKALELSLSVALDRLPSSQAGKIEQPPVSNSLMAAIKRSQANQRRQPENFSYYQQPQQQYSSCSSVPIVKVELQNLILSILDDPLVSRVFGEAGFRSYDIKAATLRPGNGAHLFGYSSSLMESFVPLGGFFSMPSDTKNTLSSSCHYVVRCHLCNEKCEQEVKALSDGDSVLEQSQSSLPSWLQIAEYTTQNGVADLKAKDDRLSLNAKISGIQKKWDSICQHHHYSQSFAKGYASQCSYPFPRVTGFQVTEERNENASKDCSKNSNESSPEQGSKNVRSSLSTDLWQSPSLKEPNTLDVLSKTNNLNVLSKPVENPSKFDCETGGLQLSASSASTINGRKSPTSATSVTTDLGLGTVLACTNKEFKKHVDQTHMDTLQQYKVNDPKALYKSLVERVGHQEEAIYAVVEAITRYPTKITGFHGASRGDTWFNFRGSDRLGKRKLGLALAEMLYGGTDSFIFADLSFQDEKTHPDALWNLQVMNKYDVSMRGTVVDYLVEKLSKRPSVVFLENVDKADLVVQNSLFHAAKTGRFMDLSGREVNISNSVFLVTSSFKKDSNCFSSGNEIAEYSEEEISLVKGRTIQIWIGFDLNDDPTSEKSIQSDPISMNKRKLTASSSSSSIGRSTDRIGILDMSKRAHKAVNRNLDLNLPADASETVGKEETESESSSENSKSWLEDFEGQIDQVVVFVPFDFEKLAKKLIKDMKECLNKIFGFECSLEIESSVMQQLLAAAYLFDIPKVEDWIQRVLMQGFVEALGKYSINARSVVKLLTCDGGFSEDQLAGSLLPAGIILS